ncbi:MAG: DUF5333 domain-containing protein [Roseobacter sp.]|jgi:hypothetical protein
MRVVMLAAVLGMAFVHDTKAQPPLGEVQEIHDGYFWLWMANKIRKECPAISPNLFDAQQAIDGLKQDARDLGYTEQQIDEYIESDAEKDRFRERRAKYFKSRGYKRTEDGYCALGREEIERNSTIGVLLRAND